MPKEMLDALDPNFVAPFTAWLCSDQCQETGSLYEVAAGYICKDRFQQSAGVQFDTKNLSLEGIRDRWAEVNQYEKGATIPTSPQDVLQKILDHAE